MDWTITKKNTKSAFIAIVSILFTAGSIYVHWMVCVMFSMTGYGLTQETNL